MKLTNEEVKVLDRYGNPLKPLFDHTFELKDEPHHRETVKGEGHALARRDYRRMLRKKGIPTSEENVITLEGEDSSGMFGVWHHPDDEVPDSKNPKKWAIEAASRARSRGDDVASKALSAAANSDLGKTPTEYLDNLTAVAKEVWDNPARVKQQKRGYRNESKLTLRRLKQIIVEEIVAETKKN